MTSRLELATTTMVVVVEDEPPPGLFFAGSDDEDEHSSVTMSIDDVPGNRSSPCLPQTPMTSSPRLSSPHGKLFLDDSDDENLLPGRPMHFMKRSQSMMQDSSEVGVLKLEQSTPSDGVNSKDELLSLPLSPTPKRGLSDNAPQKRRRISPKPQATHLTTVHFPAYVGEMLVPNAWSTVSGKGYVKPNENISVKRDEDEESKPAKPRLVKGASTKKSKHKKQMTLTSMLKTPSQKAPKKKTDTIVRLVNERNVGVYTCISNTLLLDFFEEFGRLPTEMSWWVSKLLELGSFRSVELFACISYSTYRYG